MSAPMLDRSCAAAVLALVSAAKVHAPGAELAWLLGWAMRAAGEPVQRLEPPPVGDPRREPEAALPVPSVPVARVPLRRREGES